MKKTECMPANVMQKLQHGAWQQCTAHGAQCTACGHSLQHLIALRNLCAPELAMVGNVSSPVLKVDWIFYIELQNWLCLD